LAYGLLTPAVYLVGEPGAVERYGFAYGALPQHGESAKSVSPWNTTPPINPSGMTYTPFRVQRFSRRSRIPSQEHSSVGSRAIPSARCNLH